MLVLVIVTRITVVVPYVIDRIPLAPSTKAGTLPPRNTEQYHRRQLAQQESSAGEFFREVCSSDGSGVDGSEVNGGSGDRSLACKGAGDDAGDWGMAC